MGAKGMSGKMIIPRAKLRLRIGRRLFISTDWLCQENNARRYIDYGYPTSIKAPRFEVINESVVLSLTFRGRDAGRVRSEIASALKRLSKRKKAKV